MQPQLHPLLRKQLRCNKDYFELDDKTKTADSVGGFVLNCKEV